jgi:hypothetical protein
VNPKIHDNGIIMREKKTYIQSGQPPGKGEKDVVVGLASSLRKSVMLERVTLIYEMDEFSVDDSRGFKSRRRPRKSD